MIGHLPYRRRLARIITQLSWAWLLARAFNRFVHNRRRNRRSVVLSVLALAVVSCASCVAASAAADPAIANTAGGLVRGVVAGDHRTFSGIPFAAPPVGDLRWHPPQPAAPWPGIRDATQSGSMCAQAGQVNGKPAQIGSEDCLYLNVTEPNHAGGLPVMVWIPGGGFVQGSGDQYDPVRLATTGNVVVVTINYRMDALGFLDDPDVSNDPDAGNYGLADQQAALRWVRQNIASFGGDPGNVTIFGQSAGAFSVCAHLAAPDSRSLFEKSIIQSGPCGNSFVTADVARERGKELASQKGCVTNVAACLRAKPVSELVGTGSNVTFSPTNSLRDMPWTPVAGTPALPEQPLQALRDGHAARVPLIQGSTSDEMRPFVALSYDATGSPVTKEQYPDIVRQVFGARAQLVLGKYPVANYLSPGIALATVLTDAGRKLGTCTTLPADTAAAAREPVYTYEFAQDDGQMIGNFPMGAAHGAELPYLFDGSFNGYQSPPPTPDRQILSQRLISYWTQFARTGNPNNTDAPPWPAYRPGGPTLSIKAGPDGISTTDLASAHHCPLW